MAQTHSWVGWCRHPPTPPSASQQGLASNPPVGPNPVEAPVPPPVEPLAPEVALVVESPVVASGSQVAAQRPWANSTHSADQSKPQHVVFSSQTQVCTDGSLQPGPAWGSQHPDPGGKPPAVVASLEPEGPAEVDEPVAVEIAIVVVADPVLSPEEPASVSSERVGLMQPATGTKASRPIQRSK